MGAKSNVKHRSTCPLSISLELFGDRWSLLIVRDLMVRGYRTYKEFQESGENIASNILTDRLKRLKAAGIISSTTQKSDGRRIVYRLTQKGIDLLPVIVEMFVWGARHEKTGAPPELLARMEKKRRQIIAEARRRWREGDLTPLIPRFR